MNETWGYWKSTPESFNRAMLILGHTQVQLATERQQPMFPIHHARARYLNDDGTITLSANTYTVLADLRNDVDRVVGYLAIAEVHYASLEPGDYEGSPLVANVCVIPAFMAGI
jgi:hypothetical protein